MNIPQKIKDRVAAIVTENKKFEEDKKKAEEVEKARLQKINDLREERHMELYTAAGFVLRWLCDFWNTDAAKEIFRLREEIMIFVANFWCGESVSGKSITTCATLNMLRPAKDYKKATLEYRELYKGRVSHSEEIGYSFVDYNNEPWKRAELVEYLHPDFLLQLVEAIKSGEVWNFIEYSLR